MSAIVDRIEGEIEKLSALREEGIDRAVRCFLVKRSENSKKFIVVFELIGSFYKRWDKYREQMEIAYATLEDSFNDLAAQTSFVVYGIPDADNQIDVYKIEDEERDKIPPDLQSPSWKFYVRRQPQERFTVPEL